MNERIYAVAVSYDGCINDILPNKQMTRVEALAWIRRNYRTYVHSKQCLELLNTETERVESYAL